MGVRGLCNGLGPALFGLMFHLLGINIVQPGQLGEVGETGGNRTVTAAGNSTQVGNSVSSLVTMVEDEKQMKADAFHVSGWQHVSVSN